MRRVRSQRTRSSVAAGAVGAAKPVIARGTEKRAERDISSHGRGMMSREMLPDIKPLFSVPRCGFLRLVTPAGPDFLTRFETNLNRHTANGQLVFQHPGGTPPISRFKVELLH